MSGYTIRVKNEEEFILAQKKAFKMGYKWYLRGQKIMNYDNQIALHLIPDKTLRYTGRMSDKIYEEAHIHSFMLKNGLKYLSLNYSESLSEYLELKLREK